MNKKVVAMLALLAMVLSYTSLYAQSGITISGTVVDEEKIPLVGVFISVKGTKTSTTTDLDGKYKLTLPNKEATITEESIKRSSFPC